LECRAFLSKVIRTVLKGTLGLRLAKQREHTRTLVSRPVPDFCGMERGCLKPALHPGDESEVVGRESEGQDIPGELTRLS
jgi:hypothetical protein